MVLCVICVICGSTVSSKTSIRRSFSAGARFRVSSAKAATGVGTPLTEIAIRAGVLLRLAGPWAIEQPLIGYRETIPILIDEVFVLRRFIYFVLHFPVWLVPHSKFRPALRRVRGSPEPYMVQGAFRILPGGPVSNPLQKNQDGLNQIRGRLDVKAMPHPFQDFPFRPADGSVNLLGQMKGGKDILPSGDNQGWNGDL